MMPAVHSLISFGAGGGEGKGAIAILLKLTQEVSGKEKPLKKKKQRQPVNRPIIAICNDLYAPVLRPLRAVSQTIVFAQPQVRIALWLPMTSIQASQSHQDGISFQGSLLGKDLCSCSRATDQCCSSPVQDSTASDTSGSVILIVQKLPVFSSLLGGSSGERD